VNTKLRRKVQKRKRRLKRRIDKANWSGQSPIICPPQIQYELADKQQAIAAGGIGTMLQLTKQLDLRAEINQALSLFKLHLPYDEADHVINIAFNLLKSGTHF
jgi:glycerate kinase